MNRSKKTHCCQKKQRGTFLKKLRTRVATGLLHEEQADGHGLSEAGPTGRPKVRERQENSPKNHAGSITSKQKSILLGFFIKKMTTYVMSPPGRE